MYTVIVVNERISQVLALAVLLCTSCVSPSAAIPGMEVIVAPSWPIQMQGHGAHRFVPIPDIEDDAELRLLGLSFTAVRDAMGRAFLLDPRTESILWETRGDEPGDMFGHAALAVGDTNGDGVSEVAVSAPMAPPYGSSKGPGAVWFLDGATGARLHVEVGEEVGEKFGWSLCLMPPSDPLTGATLAIGAPGWNGGQGRIVVICPSTRMSIPLERPGDEWTRFGENMTRSRRADGSVTLLATGISDRSVCIAQYDSSTMLLVRSVVIPVNRAASRLQRVVTLGDVDGDGSDDFALSFPGSGPGWVIIVSGESLTPIREVRGRWVGDDFGSEIYVGTLGGALVLAISATHGNGMMGSEYCYTTYLFPEGRAGDVRRYKAATVPEKPRCVVTEPFVFRGEWCVLSQRLSESHFQFDRIDQLIGHELLQLHASGD